MPAPVLEEINQRAESLAEEVEGTTPGFRSIWQIEGPPAAGKSACLERTAELIASRRSLVPILVSPPQHHLDVAAVAMTDVGVSLAEGGVLDGELRGWDANPGRWSARINDVQRWISDHRNEIVLLLDAPGNWGGGRDEDNFFQRRGQETALALSMGQCRRVIAGASSLSIEPAQRIELGHPRPESAWLEQAAAWGELAGSALALRESELFVRAKTPLTVRLLVAAIALGSLSEVEACASDGEGPIDAYALVRVLAKKIRKRHPRVWNEWLRFSFTRRAFDLEVFDRLVSSNAGAFVRDLTRHCLLFGDETLQMHEALKLSARHWRRENPGAQGLTRLRRESTRTLFDVHRDRFARYTQDGSPRALSESVEAYHFASVLGGPELIESVSPLFVDQLDALGWSLSVEHRKYARAAQAFEAALRWDEGDDYAHHYLAFNLYRLGTRLDDVEKHYRKAAEIRPDHPWWRSRLISFLVDRGRIGEAEALWEDTELTLGLGESDLSTSTYEHLHCWVAASLLQRGEPFFARRVLDSIPDWAQRRVDSFEALSRRADALLELGEGHAVVPGWRLRPEWWESGPELLQARIGAGRDAKRLMRWLAARVEAKDEEGLHLRAAMVEGEEQPEVVRTVLDPDRYESYSRDEVAFEEISVGSFIELGLYADSGTGADPETILRILPERPWAPPQVPARTSRRRREPLAAR